MRRQPGFFYWTFTGCILVFGLILAHDDRTSENNGPQSPGWTQYGQVVEEVQSPKYDIEITPPLTLPETSVRIHKQSTTHRHKNKLPEPVKPEDLVSLTEHELESLKSATD